MANHLTVIASYLHPGLGFETRYLGDSKLLIHQLENLRAGSQLPPCSSRFQDPQDKSDWENVFLISRSRLSMMPFMDFLSRIEILVHRTPDTDSSHFKAIEDCAKIHSAKDESYPIILTDPNEKPQKQPGGGGTKVPKHYVTFWTSPYISKMPARQVSTIEINMPKFLIKEFPRRAVTKGKVSRVEESDSGVRSDDPTNHKLVARIPAAPSEPNLASPSENAAGSSHKKAWSHAEVMLLCLIYTAETRFPLGRYEPFFCSRSDNAQKSKWLQIHNDKSPKADVIIAATIFRAQLLGIGWKSNLDEDKCRLNFQAVLSKPVSRCHSAMTKILKNFDEAIMSYVKKTTTAKDGNMKPSNLQSIKDSTKARINAMQSDAAELDYESDGMSDTSWDGRCEEKDIEKSDDGDGDKQDECGLEHKTNNHDGMEQAETAEDEIDQR